MKYLISIVSLVLLSIIGYGQNNLSKGEFNVLNVTQNFGPPIFDTIANPYKLGELRTRPQDSLVYRFNGKSTSCNCTRWEVLYKGIGPNPIPTLDQVLNRGNISSLPLQAGLGTFTGLTVPALGVTGQISMVTVGPNGILGSQTIPGGSTLINSLNGLTASAQFLTTTFNVGTSPKWVDNTATHALNIPPVSSVDSGIATPVQFATWNAKFTLPGSGTTSQYLDGTGALQTFPTIPAQFNPTTSGGGITITGIYPNINFASSSGSGITGLTGDVTGSGTGAIATTISSHVITYGKMQQASTVTLLGNSTGSTANIAEITLGRGLKFNSTTLIVDSTIFGSVYSNSKLYVPLYFGASNTINSNTFSLINRDSTNKQTRLTLPSSETFTDTTGGYQAALFITKGTKVITLGIQSGTTGPVTAQNLYITPNGLFVNNDVSGGVIQFSRIGLATFPTHVIGITEPSTDSSTNFATTAFAKQLKGVTLIRVAPLDSAAPVSNGYQVINNNTIALQTGTETNPGLISIADKKKLDSLYNGQIHDTTYVVHVGAAGVWTGYSTPGGSSLSFKNMVPGTFTVPVTNPDSSFKVNVDSAALDTYFRSIFALIGSNSGNASGNVKRIITQSNTGLAVNMPVYVNGSGVWIKSDTINFAMGVIDSLISTTGFEVTFEGTYNATAHGLTIGSYYYVTMPAGTISTIAPIKSQPVLVPIDVNTVKVHLYRPNNSTSSSGTGTSPTNISVTALPESITVNSSTGSNGNFPLVTPINAGAVDTSAYSELTNPIIIENSQADLTADTTGYSNGDTIVLKRIKFTSTGSTVTITKTGSTQNTLIYNLEAIGTLTNPMTTLGDMISGGASGIPVRVAGNITTTKQYLSQTGTGSASAAPVMSTIIEADVTNLTSDLTSKAPLTSPNFAGTPTSPTPSTGDNSTKVATTAFLNSYSSSGIYTTTPVAITNCTSSGTAIGHWKKIGNEVEVDIAVAPTITTGSTNTVINVPLPIASNLSHGYDLIGEGSVASPTSVGVEVIPSGTSASISFTCSGTGTNNVIVHFSYTID